MKNNIDFTKATVLPRDQKSRIFQIADLEKKENADLAAEIKAIGKNKGLPIYFKPGELIYFPNKEQMTIRVDDFELYNGDIQLLLGCLAWTERYGYFVMPMSIFRRIPMDEKFGDAERSDREILFDGNQFGEEMAQQQPDYQRLQKLYGKIVAVKDRLALHQPSYSYDKEKNLVIADTEKCRTLVCYKWAIEA